MNEHHKRLIDCAPLPILRQMLTENRLNPTEPDLSLFITNEERDYIHERIQHIAWVQTQLYPLAEPINPLTTIPNKEHN